MRKLLFGTSALIGATALYGASHLENRFYNRIVNGNICYVDGGDGGDGAGEGAGAGSGDAGAGEGAGDGKKADEGAGEGSGDAGAGEGGNAKGDEGAGEGDKSLSPQEQMDKAKKEAEEFVEATKHLPDDPEQLKKMWLDQRRAISAKGVYAKIEFSDDEIEKAGGADSVAITQKLLDGVKISSADFAKLKENIIKQTSESQLAAAAQADQNAAAMLADLRDIHGPNAAEKLESATNFWNAIAGDSESGKAVVKSMTGNAMAADFLIGAMGRITQETPHLANYSSPNPEGIFTNQAEMDKAVLAAGEDWLKDEALKAKVKRSKDFWRSQGLDVR